MLFFDPNPAIVDHNKRSVMTSKLVKEGDSHQLEEIMTMLSTHPSSSIFTNIQNYEDSPIYKSSQSSKYSFSTFSNPSPLDPCCQTCSPDLHLCQELFHQKSSSPPKWPLFMTTPLLSFKVTITLLQNDHSSPYKVTAPLPQN